MLKDKICGIYCIENTINHKKYIGLSEDIHNRWARHISYLKHRRHINEHLQSSWDKYGEECFNFYVLEECDKAMLHDREIYYISKYKTLKNTYGYNMTSGGDGIKDLREECGDKISLSETLYPVVQLSLNGEFIKRHRNCGAASVFICGDTSSTENIRSCCDNKYGRKSTKGYLWIYEKDFDKNRKYTYEKTKPLKRVVQYDELGNYIKIYDSCSIAEKETGINKKLISAVCHGEKRTACGYVWRLYGDPFNKYDVRNKVKIPVEQYDINNKFIRRFDSQSEVKKTLGINIGSVLCGKTKTAGGYIWKYAS